MPLVTFEWKLFEMIPDIIILKSESFFSLLHANSFGRTKKNLNRVISDRVEFR